MQAKKTGETHITVDHPVTRLPGVGKVRARQLSKIGVVTIRDLLYLRPLRYEDFSCLAQPNQLQPVENATLVGVVRAMGTRRTRRRGVFLCEAALRCDEGELVLIWFLPARLASRPPVAIGDRVLVAGTVSHGVRGLQMVHPYLKKPPTAEQGVILPVYPLTRGLQQRFLHKCLNAAMPALATLVDPIPAYLLRRQGLPSLSQAVQWTHHPIHLQQTDAARMRLAYQEALGIAIAMSWSRRNRHVSNVSACQGDTLSLQQWESLLPYKLTPGQREAVVAVKRDMERSQPMQRLVHGDVGSGKTTVAMYAITKACVNGMQAVLLTPTRILAEQHYVRWQAHLAEQGIRTALHLGGNAASHINKQLEQGEIDVVIGTQAVLELTYSRLGLLVVDEQHRFGVRQRGYLAQRYPAHCLYLSATPIPRSLALILWGDTDVSVIAAKPAGRTSVDTRWISPTKRDDLYRFVLKEVAAGHQAYIVYPRIEEDLVRGEESLFAEETAAQTPTTAEAAFQYLKAGPLHTARLGLLHGRMPVQQQEEVMRDFAQGRIDILICTTVIEVGVDVPNATVMIIEEADMYGLAQLHQLRGRVGRGDAPGYCLLVANPRTPQGAERIRVMRSTDDGFLIAEEDLRLRGPGEVLGTQQSGYGELMYARFPDDLAIIRAAQEDAGVLLQEDPCLSQPRHQALLEHVRACFPTVIGQLPQ
jgi:ATP-dependent DNA helicase RecG